MLLKKPKLHVQKKSLVDTASGTQRAIVEEETGCRRLIIPPSKKKQVPPTKKKQGAAVNILFFVFSNLLVYGGSD
ncbi:hypothetical protein HanIR_Chr02g0060891 [Helianthus annuus]|nr:hypothetical protein HanIR_Chr02g0060891 [Helianthus annuus]